MAEERCNLLKNGGGMEIYSTDEKVVGKWTDGKTLYEKSFTITNPQDGTLLMSGIDKCMTTMVGIDASLSSSRYYSSDVIPQDPYNLQVRTYVYKTASGTRNVGDLTVGVTKGTSWISLNSADLTVRYTKL